MIRGTRTGTDTDTDTTVYCVLHVYFSMNVLSSMLHMNINMNWSVAKNDRGGVSTGGVLLGCNV